MVGQKGLDSTFWSWVAGYEQTLHMSMVLAALWDEWTASRIALSCHI